MIVLLCTSCMFAIRVLGNEEEIDLLVGPQSDIWPDKFSCLECGLPGQGILESEISQHALGQLRFTDLTPQEAYAAVHGFGLPKEQNCSQDVVQELLTTQPIKRVLGEDVHGRFRIDCLELGNGTRLFFGASSHGAIVYRIAPKHSYAEQVLNDAP